MAKNHDDYQEDVIQFQLQPEAMAINIVRLQEQQKHQERRQTTLEHTLERHLTDQNATNEKLYKIAYDSFNQLKNAKYWVAGAIFGVGLAWVLVTNLDKIKALLT